LVEIAYDTYGETGSPTVLLLHGILGSRRNWRHFMRQLAFSHSHWQFIVVDLRHHGDSEQPQDGMHTLTDCAQDLVHLMARLNISPKQIWGHSFGGKVAMVLTDVMKEKPARVCILDALPGPMGPLELGGTDKSVVAVIEHLLKVPMPIKSRNYLKTFLLELGFSTTMAGWMTTNLQPALGDHGGFVWRFNLPAIPFMLRSYANTNCWPMIDQSDATTAFHFLRAQKSDRWTEKVLADFEKRKSIPGLYLHTLADSGHWVHVDNPQGLTHFLQEKL
jgi:esterase